MNKTGVIFQANLVIGCWELIQLKSGGGYTLEEVTYYDITDLQDNGYQGIVYFKNKSELKKWYLV